MKTALVTGAAGFIGFHLSRRLLADGYRVIGLDALTDYYDVRLKTRRQALLSQNPQFRAIHGRVETPGLLADLCAKYTPGIVVHLAAQAGVRHSITAPESYVETNLIGGFRLLEAVRATPCSHLLIASTSSAYGANTSMPYVETDRTAHPMSFYAATKTATEAMAHSYAHLYDIPTTLFRFFTVYGPWGRPDMALFKFTRAILAGEPIDLYNHGDMRRDFTYIDDLVAGVAGLIDTPPVQGKPVAGDSLSPVAPFRIVNVGNGKAMPLMDFVAAIETATGKTAQRNLLPMQPGDVPATWADNTLLRTLTGYAPGTDLATGVRAFVNWYRDYYRV